MTGKKTDIPEDNAVELEESALDDVAGGLEMFPKSWKIANLDGKGNDVMTEELTLTHEAIKRD